MSRRNDEVYTGVDTLGASLPYYYHPSHMLNNLTKD
jgi:hypothetical protein